VSRCKCIHTDGVLRRICAIWEHHRALADDLPDEISEKNVNPGDLACLPSDGSGFLLPKAWRSCDEVTERERKVEDDGEEAGEEGNGDEEMGGLDEALAKTDSSLCKAWQKKEQEKPIEMKSSLYTNR
jgi:hypothetical protein